MRKFVLILGVCLAFAAKAQTEDIINKQKFVNPIFNKTLLAYSKQTWNTLLSPNSISESPDDFSNPEAHIEKHNCKLLANKQDYIKFLCNVCYQDILIADQNNCSIETILYKITDDGFIEKQSFRPHEQEPFSLEYFVTKP